MQFSTLSTRVWIEISILIVLLQALVLTLFGQPPICTCGYISFWEGVVTSSGTSQHLGDWYTFSHLLHGVLFYLALWFFFPRMPILGRLLIAIGVEAAWEIVENTPWVINHYREQALARGYTGDSIINSVSDTIAMIVGFIAARKLPVGLTIFLTLGIEIGLALAIHDNLTLNIVNLIHPFNFIHDWQSKSL